MRHIVDTSVLIDNLRGGTIWDKILKDVDERDSEFIVPTIVIFELFSGKTTFQKDTKNKINILLKIFDRIELTEDIAKRAGKLYRDIGRHIDAIDYIIAASALDIGVTVVTLNKKHFEQIPNLTLYSL